MATAPIRARRPPPPLRRAHVLATEERTPRLRRFTIAGDELAGLEPAGPAASVRLLLPHHGELVLPEWNGNEFLHADGARPHLRTLTPLRIDTVGEVEVDIVLHGSGPMATWATSAEPGDPVAISGTGRGYEVDPDAPAHLLAGDESALPAIATILEAMTGNARVRVLVEVAGTDAELDLGGPEDVDVSWHLLVAGSPPGDALVDAVRSTSIEPGTRVWVAGEAASVQRIRRHLFDDLSMERNDCTVRGYWKHGRAGDE